MSDSATLRDPPESVQIVLEPQEIPDERIEAWKDDWGMLMPSEKMQYPHLNEYLEERAEEYAMDVFMEWQGHNDAHLMIDEYEVNHE